MKNTDLLFFVIIVMGLAYVGVIPNSFATNPNADYNEQVSLKQGHLWHLGKNLSIGDSYTYKICDPDIIQTFAANYHYFTRGNENHNSSVCYMIQMDFVNLLNSDKNQINRDVWVVQAAISDVATNRDIRYSVFHVNSQTFEVRSTDTIHPDTIKYADSLQNTLFSLFKYTAEPQLLQIGTEWGEVTEALYERGTNPHMMVLDDIQEYSVTQNNLRVIDRQIIPVTRNIADAFKVGYEIDIFDPFIIPDDKKKKMIEDNNNVTSHFLISSDLPFPLSAVYYSPVHVIQPQKQYEFELVTFLANNNNVSFEMKSISEELEEYIVVSNVPSETGTIALTFPDVVNPVEEEKENVLDDVIKVVDDVNIVDIIPSEEQGVTAENNSDDNLHTEDIVVKSDDVDYVGMMSLAVLLGIMVASFAVFKKFKETGFRTELKMTLKKKHHHKQTVKNIISFDDKLHIDIKTISSEND